jgi:hypothetical protein
VNTQRPIRQSSTYPRVDAGGAVLGDGFIADAQLDEWLRNGLADRDATNRDEGVLQLSDGSRFSLVDGLRILGRRDGDSDPYGLTGRVMSLRSVLRRGGLLSSDGVRIGPAIYDAAFGVLLSLLAASSAAEEEESPPTLRQSATGR